MLSTYDCASTSGEGISTATWGGAEEASEGKILVRLKLLFRSLLTLEHWRGVSCPIRAMVY
jgi:hypothetical protein